MSFAAKHILLVNFDFPPNNGIGGRRWGKLAKGLAVRGYQVHVIKADPVPLADTSPWQADVVHPNIHVHSIPRTYPVDFSHPQKGIIGKVKYHLNKFRLMLTEKGTIYDISIGWDKYFDPLAAKLIEKHQIKNVIATGAPWNLLVYTCRLKRSFPDLFIVSDFRDPWLEAKNYGMENLSPQRKKTESEEQEFVIANSNVVTTPAPEMTNRFAALYGNRFPTRFELLGHFYDQDDMGNTSSVATGDKIIFVYGGDLYLGVESQLQRFVNDLDALKKSDFVLYSMVEVRIFTDSAVPSFLQNCEVVKVSRSIGKKIFGQLREANYCLIFLPENKKNHITTKSIEYLPFKKPFVVYAEDGDFTSFVRENHLGFCMCDNVGELQKIITSTDQFKPNEEMIYGKSLLHTTDKLISFLK